MKSGRTIQVLATELDRQKKTAKDYLAQSRAVKMSVLPSSEGADSLPVIQGLNGGNYGITKHAHAQLAQNVNIPKTYYDRMQVNAPHLLAENVNEWLGRDGKKRMVRTLDGSVRAFLSTSYRPLDNFDLMATVMPILQEQKCTIVSAELTELRLYIKVTFPSLRAEVTGSRQKGDIVEAGAVFSNSEVGAGAVRVEPLIHRLVCLNGMIAADHSLKKYHIGKGADVDGVRELLSDETIQKDDETFWLKVRDVARSAFDPEIFSRLVLKMSEATSERIEAASIESVVELTTNRIGINSKHGDHIMKHLIENGDLSKWGMVNAITQTANIVEDYEDATSLERAGGQLLDLPRSEWREIAA